MGVTTKIESKERIFIGKYGHKETSGVKKSKTLIAQEKKEQKEAKARLKATEDKRKAEDKIWEEKEAKRVKDLMASGMPEWQAKGFKGPR
jgi:hypothetical protein